MRPRLHHHKDKLMTWNAPKIVEISASLEVTTYASAVTK